MFICYLLWRSSIQVEVLELNHDPLVLERLKGVCALQDVLEGVEEGGRAECAILRQLTRRGNVALITSWKKRE